MPIAPNLTKRKLATGELVIGVGIRQFQSVEIGLMAKAAGFDFIFIDREHSTMELSRAGEICTAALGQGVTPIVRSAGPEPHQYVSLFDCGAQGIVVPHIRTAEDARRLVDAQKLPPIGSRSLSRSSAATAYETMDLSRFGDLANGETMAVALVEDREGVTNAFEIASVAHLDAILIGASDLCADLGLPGQFEHPTALEACRRVVEACRAHSIPCGIAGLRKDSLIRQYVNMGVRMIHAGTDAPILVEALRKRASALSEMWSESKSSGERSR